MRIIVVHRTDRLDRLPLPEGWDVWETDTEIGQTYKDLAAQAVEWGHDVIVVQDDVRFDPPSEVTDAAIIAYGQTRRTNHVCPRAFSANPEGWKLLGTAWRSAPHTLCPGFTWAVNKAGIVLDITAVDHG